jgi:hypothetical protein
MATSEEIESALLAPWQSPDDGITPPEWTATAPELIAFDNATFTPPTDGVTAWMEVSTNAGPQRAQNIGATDFIGNPTLTIAAHAELGKGKATARQLIDSAVAMYRGRLIRVSDSTMVAYSISSPVPLPADGWFKLGVQISFAST